MADKLPEVSKIPVAKNKPPEDKCYYLSIQLEFDAANDDEAKGRRTKIIDMLEGYANGEFDVVSHELTMDDGDAIPVYVDSDEENEADTALRKLTQNKGNKLWIEYLQQQLKMAKGLGI